ncbi:uncharacterized protein LOC119688048 [Teleopsis dalmanni]|uniref:uncharacterized protein LOC119688048 n=1 Tax=Teleopsis dalmanni TaxID=139649 RepID=UPI0018CE99FF|nr:uncharacterized protein LOC119688048 [Teleopsis dalmanni]
MFRNKMKRSQFKNLFLMLIILLALSVTVNEARGGRRGGSFGGIFGSWRKYKKPSSGGGSSRRVISGSPVHTSVTKMMNQNVGSHNSHRNHHSGQKKIHASYPRQEGVIYHHNSGNLQFHTPNGRTDYHLPAGSSYHTNQAALPVGAVYYAQPPRHSSTGDLIFDAMAAHAITRAVVGNHGYHHHHYHHHRYPQNNEGATESNNRIIIINNESSAPSTTDQHLWPTDGEVPLAPFNNSVLLDVKSNIDSVFEHKPESQQPNIFSPSMPTMGQLPAQPPTQEFAAPAEQIPTQNEHVPHEGEIPPGGIICVPMQVPEADPNDPTKTINVLKTACFPAPSVPTEEHHGQRHRHCVMRTVTETDPEDATKTIEVQKEVCVVRRRKVTTQSPEVAGDIVENGNTTTTPTSETTLPMLRV